MLHCWQCNDFCYNIMLRSILLLTSGYSSLYLHRNAAVRAWATAGPAAAPSIALLSSSQPKGSYLRTHGTLPHTALLD